MPQTPLELRHDVPIFEYTDHNRRRAWCHLRAYDTTNAKTLIIVTELQDNPGMSVTNAIECVAQAAVTKLNLDPWKLTLVEHYNAASYHDADRPETFDLVTFAHIRPVGPRMFEGPRWQRLITCHDEPQSPVSLLNAIAGTPSEDLDIPI